MAFGGVGPGPVVGRAWRHLKELRLDRGPLSREEAEVVDQVAADRHTMTADGYEDP